MNLTAGRPVACVASEWRAVCDDGWDEREARVLCRRHGFPQGISGLIGLGFVHVY